MKKLKYIIPIATFAILIVLISVLFIGNYSISTGRCIVADSGSYLIVMDNSPVVMSNRTNNEGLLDNLQTGDEILIVHGAVAESYPGQTGTYFCIRLSKGDRSDVPEEILIELTEMGYLTSDQTELDDSTEFYDKIPMVKVGGKLYYDTGRESTVTARCGVMDGKITSSVDGTEIPMEDDQSNFGSGYGYQYGEENTIEVYINEKWIVFEHRSGDGSMVLIDGEWISRADVE